MAVKGYKIAVGTLTDKYARLLGELSVIEKMAEDAVGVAEIDEAVARIDLRRREIERALICIEEVIELFDPAWDPAAVRPLRPKRVNFPPGTISKAAYDILRKAVRPMSTREIAKEVATLLGIDDRSEAALAPIDIALATTLPQKLDALHMEPGPPRRWSVRREPMAEQGDGAASTPAIRPRQVA